VTGFVGRDEQARIAPETACRVLAHVTGMRVPDALYALRFSPSLSCPEIARVVQLATAKASCEAENLVVRDGSVREGADVIRLRRQAHGIAGWITTKTTDITVEVSVAASPPHCPGSFLANGHRALPVTLR
jgi:ribosomal protein L22